MQSSLKIGLAQISPVWLNRKLTTEKVIDKIHEAGEQDCDLLIFGEALLPGYPFWLAYTDGASFDSEFQKQVHSHYMFEAVCIEEGHLDSICDAAKRHKTAIYLGIVERPLDRGGHSLYCSLVFIDRDGKIASVHRKLQPASLLGSW